MKTATFQDEMPCGLVKSSQHFGGACCLLVAECLFYPDDRSSGCSGTLATFHKTTRHIILEDSNLHFRCLENLQDLQFSGHQQNSTKICTMRLSVSSVISCSPILMSIHLSACGEVPLTGSCRFLSGKHFATVGWISCQTSAIYKYKLIVCQI